MGAVIDSVKEKTRTTTKVANKLAAPSMGEMIDNLQELREKKRSLEAEVAKVQGEFDAIEEQLLELLETQKVDGSKGKKASVSITRSVHANIKDFDALCKYVKKTGYFHLFQRRLSDTAFRELLEQGKTVPGLEPFTKTKLNLRSL